MSTVKEQILKLADSLPDDATWDQVMYELYVRQKIAEGERAVTEGRVVPHDEMEKRFSEVLVGCTSGRLGKTAAEWLDETRGPALDRSE